MPLLDHLGELRRRLTIVVVSVIATAIVIYFATPTLIEIMIDPIRNALPEGWSLPTLTELDEVVRNLGGYAVVGDKMKRSGDRQSFREKRTALPDSLQLRITPKGYIGEDGKMTDTNSGYVLTDTRENRKALFMKIVNGSNAATITPEGLPSYAAVHVRGVRPAPSSWEA